jgi:hypothetical protein
VFGLGGMFLSAPADKGGVLIWFTDLIFGYEQFTPLPLSAFTLCSLCPPCLALLKI